MALIIKADMPVCCWYGCDLWSEGICVPLQKAVDFHTRANDCPIIGEIPDSHGDLIDKDELMSDSEWFCKEVARVIHNAPTIVEASNGTDN